MRTSSRSKRGRLEQSPEERLLESSEEILDEQEQQNISVTEEVPGSQGSETVPTSPLSSALRSSSESSLDSENSEETAEETEERRAMAPTTTAEVDAMTDADMRALLKEQLAATGGGEKKNTVLLKQEPPELDECEDFSVWKVKFTVWQAGTAMSDQQQACCVIQGLRDDHKHHKKGLQSLLLKTLTEGEQKKPSMTKVMEFLDEQLGGTTEEKLFEAYIVFIRSEIKPGEKYEDFVVRFEGALQSLIQKGKNIKLPDQVLAMQLMMAAKLTSAMLIPVRANVKWDGDSIYNDTKKAISRICHGEVNKVGSNAQVKMATDEGELDIRKENNCFVVNGERLYSAEEAQVFLGEGGKPARGGGAGGGRGFRGAGRGGDRGGDRGGKFGAISKKCWNCGKPGHRAANCRSSKKEKDDDEEEGHWIDNETWCTEGNEEEPENLDEYILEEDTLEEDVELPQLVTSDTSDDEEEEQCHVDINTTEIKTFTVEAEGAAGMDSCCSRTLMGKKWYDSYKELATKEMLDGIKGPEESNVSFTFGNGGKMYSSGRYLLPVQIHGQRIKISVELVKSDIPLLLSKSTMQKCGIVLDFAQTKVTAFGKTESMKMTTIGHPIIRILPRDNKPFMAGVMVVEENLSHSYQVLVAEKVRMSGKDQREIIRKMHKQAGHQSKKKFMDFLKQGSIDWDEKVLEEELETISKNCHGCILKRKSPSKPVACIPVSYQFNQCIGVDLKINSDGTIILYIIDMWSKLIQARLVKSKKSEEITAAIMECWVAVYGAFERTIHDNGGEFCGAPFKEMMDLLGIQDGTSAAHSPWSCGVVERHHAVVDGTYQALLRDFPSYKKETLLQWAVFVKNSTTTTSGWTPYQIVFGRNPKVPCLLTSNIAGLREEVVSRQMLENLNALEQGRVEVNRALCDARLKRMMKGKVRKNLTVFKVGDKIFWRDTKNIKKWRQGKVLAADGTVLFVRDGGEFHRVSADMAIKVNEEYDKNGVLLDKQQAQIVESIRRRRSRRISLQSEDEEDKPGESGEEAGRPGQPGRPGGDSSALPGTSYSNPHPAPHSPGRAYRQVSTSSNSNDGTNSLPAEERADDDRADDGAAGNDTDDGDGDQAGGNTRPCPANSMTTRSGTRLAGRHLSVSQSDTAETTNQPSQPSEAPSADNLETFLFPRRQNNIEFVEPMQERQDRREMRMAEEAEKRMVEETEKRGSKRKETDSTPAPSERKSKAKKSGSKFPSRLPISRGDIIRHDGKISEVGKRAGKTTGKLVNTFNVYPRNGDKPYCVNLDMVEFEKLEDGEQINITQEDECLMEMVPYHLHGNQECREAKREEIDKIVNKYKAVEEVRDEGQVRISTKFVMWYKKSSDGSIKTRSRLVCRGFEEVCKVDSDSPTMEAGSVKLILAYARAKNMKIISADVKAAFLQGLPLTERTVFVQPPREAQVKEGHIWKLRVSLYGLQDASLRFHWKVRAVFKQMGLVQSRLDPAVFYMRNSKGEVTGIIGSHVDDFLVAGSAEWTEEMVKGIADRFELGTVEKNNFLYCGHRVKQDAEGNITLDQNEYAADIKDLYISPQRKRENQEPVTEKERKQMRTFAGKIGWLSRTSRPDLTFAQIEASSAITQAKVADLKQLQKAVIRIKEEQCIVEIPQLPSRVEDWSLSVFTDASWQNLNGVGSTGGRALFLNGGGRSFAVHWAAHRLRRVCHSSQSSEIMSMNEGLSDAAYIRTMVHELSQVWIEAELITDCKNAFQALTKTTAPTDKRVKCEAQAVREALLEGEVKKIRLVKGEKQMADVLTKRKTFPASFLHIVQTGASLEQLGY